MLLVYFKLSTISNFTKTCPDRADLIHVDGQTDRYDAHGCFSWLFANTPKTGTTEQSALQIHPM